MAEDDCCPECGSTEGYECPTCCTHPQTEVKTIKEGHKGRYLREICVCVACGYFEVMNEIDYYTEFPPL